MLMLYFVVAAATFLIYKLFLAKSQKPGWWKKHGILEIDPSTDVSSFDIFLGKRSIVERDEFVYREMGAQKFCGVMESGKPVIFLKDINLIKKILIKDFDHFSDRGDIFPIADKSSIFNKILGLLTGDQWKKVRSELSPTFTTGKIRRMMEHFNSAGQEWIEMLTEKAKTNSTGSTKVNVLSCINQYTTEIIARSVFGLRADGIKNPDSVFTKKAAQLVSMGGMMDLLKMKLITRFPKICQMLDIELFNKESCEFFSAILRKNLKARLRGELNHNDFQQLLVEARMGKLKAEGSDDLNEFEKDSELKVGSIDSKDKSMYLTDDIIVGQGFAFFFGGSSSITNFIAFAAHTLAVQQGIQTKLRDEVQRLLKEDKILNYDDLGRLPYLDMVVCEVLRKYPGAFRLERVCLKNYYDHESGLYIKKDTVVVIPVQAIHNDAVFYENPEQFSPEEHFSPEKKRDRSPYSFLPFGSGPRNCIGMRFALIESKAAIAKLIQNFVIEPTENTTSLMPVHYMGVLPFPPKDLELKLTLIK